MKLLIKNGNILINGKIQSKNLFINNGKIIKISSKEFASDRIINAKNNFILPGLIDVHVHAREPGLTHKEDFYTASMAAARGGITSFLDMPNTIPPTTTIQFLKEKRELAKKSIVNYGFNFGATSDNISEIKKAENIAAVKLYMDHTTGNLKVDDWNVIKNVFQQSKLTIVHAEDQNVKNAVDLIIKNKIINKLHIAHVSSAKELNFAAKYKLSNISVEVTPHHLFMNNRDIKKLGSFAECKPVLKSPNDQKLLWIGIKTGKVDIIATDHAPHLKEEKEKIEYPFGMPGLETMLPLLLDASSKNKIDLLTINKLCCENPAKIFKIRNKGFIKEGYDADITIVDLDKKQKVRNDELATKCKWSPFDGKLLKGWPITTIVNGNIVYDNNEVFNIKSKELEYY